MSPYLTINSTVAAPQNNLRALDFQKINEYLSKIAAQNKNRANDATVLNKNAWLNAKMQQELNNIDQLQLLLKQQLMDYDRWRNDLMLNQKNLNYLNFFK